MTDELEKITQKIDTLARAELSSGQPYLLSKLGMDIGPDLKIIKQSGMSLTEFIDQRLSDRYKLIFTGIHRNIQSLILAEAQAEADAPTLSDTAKPRPERFNYRFWAAFSVPLASQTRFLNTENFTFVDEDSKPVGPYEVIDAAYIAEQNIQKRDEKILENIYRWIDDKGFEVAQFLAKNRIKSGHSTAASHQKTLLHAFLEVLDNKHISTLTLPLDVVAAMLKKPV